jgi:hypothetical protein
MSDWIVTTAARYSAVGITPDLTGGNFYLAVEPQVRKLNVATGELTTIAGSVGGYKDGIGTAAMFYRVSGITTDSTGSNLYVAENNRIRKIVVATGEVTTLAGSKNFGYLDGIGTAARFGSPQGIAIDSTGTYLYVVGLDSRIRKIAVATGVVTTVAGSGVAGYMDGIGTATQFNRPTGISIDSTDTNLYVTDTVSNTIRKIVIETSEVTTFAGSGVAGYMDGIGTAAQFNNPWGVGFDSTGTNLYVSDSMNHRIRKIVVATGEVTTIAGSTLQGYTDGTGTATQFNIPRSITVVSDDKIYVVDYFNNVIRKVTNNKCLSGTYLSPDFTSCIPCPSGTYSLSSSKSCTDCSQPSGTQYVTAICTPSTDTQIATKQICQANQFLLGFSSGSSTSLGSSGTCSNTCIAGTYTDSSNVCSPCPQGLYSSIGSFICSNTCPSGTLFTLGSACFNFCPAGKWYNSTLATCSTCPSGTSYVGAGAASVSDCTPCGPGTYSGLGFPTCLACPPGTSFSGTRGTSDAVCTPCAAGTYSNTLGSASCSVCPTGTNSNTGSTFCHRATGGIIEDKGLYITHTFTTSGNFVTSAPMDIVDELIITATTIYSKGSRSLGLVTYTVNPTSSTTGFVDRGFNYMNIFIAGTPQYVIIYLKTPCPTSNPKWDPVNGQCLTSCPLAIDTSNTCTKCSTFGQFRSVPSQGAAYCETGFTLSGLTCNGTSLTCPDPSWTLSGSLCTKTEMKCPANSIMMAPQEYCLYSNGLSTSQVSVDLVQAATSTLVSKPAYGNCVNSCPIGSYKDVDCVQCPGNQTTLSTGSSQITDCVCPVGTYGINGSGICTSCGPEKTSLHGTQTQAGCTVYCSAGSYANDGICTICPYGTSPAGSMSVSACGCAPGTFLSGGSCVSKCPAGMYGDEGTKTCIQCPGTQISDIGTVGVNGCKCPDGTGGLSGSGVCTSCTSGQVSTVTNLTCPDSTWTLNGSVCSKVSDYDCSGVSYDDIIEAGQLLEPSQIDIGTSTRTFTNQPTGLLGTASFTISLDLQVQNDSTSWRDIFQNIPGSTWPIDNSNKRKPSMHISGTDTGARKVWFMYSTNPGGPPVDFNFAIDSGNFQFAIGTWFNCTCTVDGPNKKIALHINGVKKSETVSTGTLTKPSIAPSFTWRPTNTNNNGSINVKNVYWWNQVLSDDQIVLFNNLPVEKSVFKTSNTCYSTAFTKPSPACTFTSYTCPDVSWTLRGSVCTKAGNVMQPANVNMNCPVSGQYTCPSGYTLSGTNCVSNTPTGYTCPTNDGSITEQTSTSRTIIGNSVLEGDVCKRYSCTTGTNVSLVGTNCVSMTSVYTCPSDAPTLDNITCFDYTCDPGWTLIPPDSYSTTYRCKSPSPTCGNLSSYYGYPITGTYDSTTNTCNVCPTNTLRTYTSIPSTCTAYTSKVYDPVRYPYAVNNTSYADKCPYQIWANPLSQGCAWYQTSLWDGCYDTICLRSVGKTYSAEYMYSYKTPTYTKIVPATPNYTTTPATVYSRSAATNKYDTITALPGTRGQSVAGKLTQQLALIMGIQTINAINGVNGRQCICAGNMYWDLISKMCVNECPAATYADGATKTCKPCPANKTSSNNSTSINQCVCSYVSPFWSGFSCMQEINPSVITTGGTTEFSGNYTVHTFNSSGNFSTLSTITASILSVGGGSGGNIMGGNGGEVRIDTFSLTPGTYSVTIGNGGSSNVEGSPSYFSNFTFAGGGARPDPKSPSQIFSRNGTFYINGVQQFNSSTRTISRGQVLVDKLNNTPKLWDTQNYLFCDITRQSSSFWCQFLNLTGVKIFGSVLNFNYGLAGGTAWCINDSKWGSRQMCFGGGGGGISAPGNGGGGDGVFIDFINNTVKTPVYSGQPNTGGGGGATISGLDRGGTIQNGGSGVVKISYTSSYTCPPELPYYNWSLLSPVCTTCLVTDTRTPRFDAATGLCDSCPAATPYYNPTTKTCVSVCPSPLSPNPQFNNVCAVPPLTCNGARPYFNGYECTSTQVNFSTQDGATGGNSIINNGLYVIHIFTSDGTFVPLKPNLVGDILVVGGGGGGGTYSVEDFVNPRTAGGGGGGEVKFVQNISFGQQSSNVKIGQGGNPNQNGNDTLIGTYIAKGGGAGGNPDHLRGFDGSSGGGSVYDEPGGYSTITFGFKGGNGAVNGAGGGGGSYSQGFNGSNGVGGLGGSGILNKITGSEKYYGGGGGGSGVEKYMSGGAGGTGGAGGGGAGAGSAIYNYGSYQKTNMVRGENGTPNTGGGGGGGASVASVGPGNYVGNPVTNPGSKGGSGIVIIRYSTSYLCPINLPYFNPGLKVCTSCPDENPFYDGNTCAKCPVAKPYWNGIACIAACPSVLPFADKNNVCQLPCSAASPNWDGNQCTKVCPPTKPIATNGICGTCPAAAPHWNPPTKSCVITCPEATDASTSVCISCFDVDNTKPYWNGAACQACPPTIPAWTGPLTGCQSCPAAAPVYYNNACRPCYDVNPLRPLYNKAAGGYYMSSVNRCGPCPVATVPAWNNTLKICQTCIDSTSIATPFWDTSTNACTSCPATRPYWNSRVCALPTNIITTPMTSTITANVTAAATTSVSPAWKAFDGDATTFWQSNSMYVSGVPYDGKKALVDVNNITWRGEFLQVEFPYSYIISSYTLNSPNLRSWVILGSGDGFNWNPIDAKSDVSNFSQTFYITPPISSAYPVYRLVATKSSATSVSVNDWTLQTANAAVSTDIIPAKSAFTVISGAVSGCDSVSCVLDKSSSVDITDLVYGNYPPTVIGTDLLSDKAQEALSNCSSNVDCGFVQFDFLSNVSTFNSSAPYTVSTMMTTGNDIGVFQKKYGTLNAPKVRAPPGFKFDYNFIRGTRLGSTLTNTIDVCAQACSKNSQCKGFNYYYLSSVCEFYSTMNPVVDSPSSEKCSFVRDPSILMGVQNTNRLPYVDLSGTGSSCQNMTACNTDIVSLVGQLGTTVQSFSTSELDSCNYCPVRAVSQQGPSNYILTNEANIAYSVSTTSAVQSGMMFSNVDTYTNPVINGGNYRIRPYVQSETTADVNIRSGQIWMGSEPFAAGIVPKNCFNVCDRGPPFMCFDTFRPLYSLGTVVKAVSTGEVCVTTAKGTYTYQTCSGSCLTGTDLDPGTRNVTTAIANYSSGNPDLMKWEFIPVPWVKNGYFIRSKGSEKRAWGIGPSRVKYDAITTQGGWKPPNYKARPFLKWGSYIGSYKNIGYTTDQQFENFGAAFAEGLVTAFTLGFADVNLVDKNDPNNIFFTSFPPQFNTEAYPFDSLYGDLDQLPKEIVDQAPYVFVLDPI